MNRMERRAMLNAGLGRLAKAALAVVVALTAVGAQAANKPNIVVMMIDDIGGYHIGAYHQGLWPAEHRTSTGWLKRA